MIRKLTRYLLPVLLPLSMLVPAKEADAQLPVCPATGGYVYIHGNDGNIHNWDPSLPLSATNPVINTIAMPASAVGLAVSPNLNSPGPSPTFYTTIGGQFYYYNGTTWVNTGHTAGAVNPGGGGGYIYNLEGGSGQVFKYDGTGSATLLLTVPGFSSGGPYDLVADCVGNFYILRTAATSWLRKYSPAGVLLQQWTVTGAPDFGSGGGFAIIGNTVYYHNLGGLFSGVMGPTSIAFNPIPDPSLVFPNPGDFASCPVGGAPVVTMNDTVFNCVPGSAKTITAGGIAPFSYNVISGSATVTGTGPSFNVTNAQAATVVLHSVSNSLCGSGAVADTFLIIPAPLVNAGPDDTLFGCATYIDTLHGSLGNSTSWISYTYNWTPSGVVTSGGTTLNPVVAPTQDTTFVLTVSTGTSQGGCTLRDSLRMHVKDESVIPDYTFTIRRGCEADTVLFNNTSFQGTSSFWDFADGTTDTATNPKHIYPDQDIYNVKLISSNYMCTDSVIKIIDVRHPLLASFTVDDDTVCQGTAITFSNTSTVSVTPPVYHWDFGDGSSTALTSPGHTYAAPGIYQTMLVVKDAIPCYDTAYRTVVIDSLPALEVSLSTHELCTGQAVTASASYLASGFTGIDWNFGDNYGTTGEALVNHAYTGPGTFYITTTAHYRSCGDTTVRDSVNVHLLPVVKLGNDTTICLHGDPIFLTHTVPVPFGSHFVWNTGDTTEVLKVVHDGTYSLTVVTANDCSSTDEIVINKDCYTDVPNSFTPNNDGNNDYFFPRQLLSLGVSGFKMQVLNRWGQVVFETTNPAGRGWDGMFNGKEQPTGVYIYNIHVVLKNGRTEQQTGNVTLLR